jgi:hypothetical protein
MAKDACHICGRSEHADIGGGSLTVHDCRECELPTCDDCVECDYDVQGDPPHFVCTQWDCKQCIEKQRATDRAA